MEEDRTLEPYEAPRLEELGAIGDITASTSIAGALDGADPAVFILHHSL